MNITSLAECNTIPSAYTKYSIALTHRLDIAIIHPTIITHLFQTHHQQVQVIQRSNILNEFENFRLVKSESIHRTQK